METAPLKSFATWARAALIREVTARIAVVLAPASAERVEEPNAVAALEKAVVAAGGGEKGRAAVGDMVAYTWFNRIIALRFMDANGYTGLRVVSPQTGVPGGQPEVLAEAKRGNIDAGAVTNKRSVDAITGLLNGTRRSDDPQGEAYALLLAEYCRHWNRAMPFMFEREGDYTELLIPANLLADGSVLNHAVAVLTEDVCQDVEVIGWLYQFYISERKDEVFAGFKNNKRAGAAEIPAATQLFTPHWIVRYLVENSVGRLWMLNRPTSHLANQMDYYVAPVGDETDFLKVGSPEELKVIDPACGSGHMLTYAFDLLYTIYEEEGYAPSDIPRLILINNLYGTEIDPRAGVLAAFALAMKARARKKTFFNNPVDPNICVLEPISFKPHEMDLLVTKTGDRAAEEDYWNLFACADVFGALVQPRADLGNRLSNQLQTSSFENLNLLTVEVRERALRLMRQADMLSSTYHVVVTNPPYMGAGNMGSILSEWLTAKYPAGKQDLYGAFMLRSLLLTKPGGLLAMITGDSWMTITTFDGVRTDLLKTCTLLSFLHLRDSAYHMDTFGANAAFVLSTKPSSDNMCTFVQLSPLASEDKRLRLLEALKNPESPWVYRIEVEFTAIPGAPLAYWMDPKLIDLYSHPLIGDKFDIKAGVGTRNDELFMRFHWEVSSGQIGLGGRWVLTDKAGEFRKWYAGFTYVMHWENDGFRIKNYRNPDGSLKSRPQNIQYMFLEGVTWGKVGAGATSFRWRPAGYGFNDAAPAIFGPGSFDLLTQLNSALGKQLVEVKGSTLNVQTGMVAELPIVETDPPVKETLRKLGHRAVEISKRDWDTQEISSEFTTSEFLYDPVLGEPLEASFRRVCAARMKLVSEMKELEDEVDRTIQRAAGLPANSTSGERKSVSLLADPVFRYSRRGADGLEEMQRLDAVSELVSFAVGCMFGRYSLDEPGLILASQGDTFQNYFAKVPTASFRPDRDNVIPIVDGDWFEDDIVARFRQFLRVAFGDQHFEENLRFVTDALGVKDLRDYFVKSFYKDHVQRYKKRPIYWLFSSSKGSFNALIYMHRYIPSTASVVLNEYLREYRAKLDSSRQHHERLVTGGGTPRQQGAAQKEADRLRKVLLELDEYEHDVLYPLATQQVQIDLDDGVRVNYPKFGTALKKIPGLEAGDD